MKREEVYRALDSEREYQINRWGGESHDNKKSVGDFIVYMETHLQKAKEHYSSDDFSNQTLDELRKVTAIGVACFEVHGVSARRQRVRI
jgi:hypothetical protein